MSDAQPRTTEGRSDRAAAAPRGRGAATPGRAAGSQVPAMLRAQWQRLAPREQTAVLLAVTVVAIALVWLVALAPALAVLRTAPAQHRLLDTQLTQMQRLQREAQQLAAQPRRDTDESMRALEASIRQRLGTSARYAIQGEQVTVTLAGVAPDALALWLVEARANARAFAQQAQLTRNPAGLWEGRVVLSLPPRG